MTCATGSSTTAVRCIATTSTDFVRKYDVATHQHCEATMGRPVCGHYSGLSVNGAIDGFLRLYAQWIAGSKPDCSRLSCLD